MLVDNLIKNGWLKTEIIISAFRKIKRADFLPASEEKWADLNEALPIGYGQTISQPLVVAFMLELLKPAPGQKILDIGSGSGWTTALLAEIVSQKQGGKVIGLEIVPELEKFGEANIEKYGFIANGAAENLLADGNNGCQKEAPFDGILVSASAERIPEDWKKQLKTGGRIVCSLKNSIWLIKKTADNQFSQKEFPGFVFVPLINNKND
jgi:protein-L-isoaspartate(D-aspartate) O-methyltransferase